MLQPIGWLYGRIIEVRNHLYDRGVFRSHSLGARAISIGNITTGGTGKTPLVALVAEILADAGERVCILTRGYGRKSSGRVLVSDGENVLVDARVGGDEPVELARKLIGKATVVADADRVSAADWAKDKFGVTAFVLDDAFQHRRAKRDLDIVCIDATDPFGHRSLPREPFENLARADAFVITRSELADDIESLRSKLSSIHPATPIFTATAHIIYNDTDIARPAYAFCAVANPNYFFELLRRNGRNVVGTRAFRDHHYFTKVDIRDIEQEAARLGTEVLLVTAKDAVKLEGLSSDLPIEIIRIEMKLNDEEKFQKLVTSLS